MEVETAPVLLVREEGKVFVGAVAVAFLSLQLSSVPFYLLLLWCCAAGLLCAYCLFRNLPRAPNLLFHMPHPSRIPSPSSLSPATPISCPVCSQPSCKRHAARKPRSYFKPWENLKIPQSVDKSLSEVLEIIMQRFVYSWHRHLAPASESMEDEMRVAIRYAASILLQRVQRVDMPRMITSKFLQAIASHIHIYTMARERLPADASVASIEAAVLKAYGDHTHTAMRGRTGNLRYFRQLAKALLPILLPEDLLQSKIICSLVAELFASKVFVPAMNFTAKPDFINRMLLTIFDKNSRLEPVFGPESKGVPFLAQWASVRSRRCRELTPLDVPLPELLDPQHNLYVFMQFMKSRDDIYVLQIYLTLDELKQKVGGIDANKAEEIVAQVENLYKTYLIPSAYSYLQLDQSEVEKIEAVLSDSGSSSLKKCEELRRTNVFGRLKGHIYHELLMKVYYPRFLQSYEFFELYLGKKSVKSEGEGGTKSKGDRWRQKTKQLKKLSQPSVDTDGSSESSEGVANGGVASEPKPKCRPPRSVKIVDAETQMDGIRPYTIYVLLITRDGEESDTRIEVVRRRYKEFVMLDTKLHQFRGDLFNNVQLPSKKTFRNMDKAFVETRVKELEQYLGTLITYPGVQDSQILASFLSSTSDPSLFLPDSVTGKMKKAVPSMLKKERVQHVEELIQTLQAYVEPPNTQPSPETVAMATAQCETNKEKRDSYLLEAADDLSDFELTKSKPWLHSSAVQVPPGGAVDITCVLDLLLLVAVSVYHVSPFQLTSLMLAKLLAQNTVDTLAYRFVAGKVEIMATEAHIIRLIHIFRDNLFFSKDGPRNENQIRDRLQETLERLLNYPNSLLVKAIGQDRFFRGTATIVEGLQCRELNKQLFFKLLDIILLELFPELGEAGGGEEGGGGGEGGGAPGKEAQT